MSPSQIAQVASFLNVSPNQVKRCEEWVSVLFVQVHGCRPRFVSKKVISMIEYTDFREFTEALDMLKFSQIAGEKVVSAVETFIPAASIFLPASQGWLLTTESGRIIKCTAQEKVETRISEPLQIKYVGATLDQFASSQGFYQ